MQLRSHCLARPLSNLPETKAELGVPADVFPVLPIIVGRPRGEAPPTPRYAPRIVSWKRAPAASSRRSVASRRGRGATGIDEVTRVTATDPRPH